MRGPRTAERVADLVAEIPGLRVEAVLLSERADHQITRIDVWRCDTGALIFRHVLGGARGSTDLVARWAREMARRVAEGSPLPEHADQIPSRMPRRVCTECGRPAPRLAICRRCEGELVRAERRLVWGAR